MMHSTFCSKLSFTDRTFHARGLSVSHFLYRQSHIEIRCRRRMGAEGSSPPQPALGLPGWSGGLSVVLVLTGFMAMARGDDWPQILGPSRNGQAAGPALAPSWSGGLSPKWTVDLGSGYAGVAVVEGTVLVPHRIGDQESLKAIRLDDGQELWETSWPASYRATINPDNGPRCVPAVQGERVVCYGAAGDLVCVRLKDGKLIWSRRLRNEYGAEDGYFGAGSSPLILDDLVLVCLGGEGAGVVAVDLASGKTRWAATDYDASYASPIVVDGGTRKLALVVTRLRTILINTADGTVLSEVRFGSRGPTVNAATPLAVGKNQFLLTANYGVGATLLQVNGNELIERFRGSDLLSSQYNTPVQVGTRLVGIHGREDIGVASLRSINLEREEVVWEQAGFGMAHLLAVQEQVLALSLEGQLVLLDGGADTYRELAVTSLPEGTYRALPAMVGRQLVIRASRGPRESQLFCVELPGS